MGINFDWDEVFIGGELRTDVAELSPTVQLQLNPSLSLAFPGRGVIFDMSFNVPFQFYVRDSVLRPFTGPGLALVDHTGGGHADLFLNLIGGLLFDLGNVDPFLQLKVMIPHHAAVELMGGVLFRL
jgi:hypothetical protein